jgi:CheY-like chemotaxis protein
MDEKVLFVDDEVAALLGYQRILRREFTIDVANGGEAALAKVANAGPYAVVVSDMRMPVMNGIQLLNRIRILTPDSTRIMLTGNNDLDTATKAVNDGRVFRFLNKPASKETIAAALTAGIEQFRLVTAEKELLEETLSGSIKVLTEVLSLVSPGAFSRALRIRQYVRHVAAKLNLSSPWRFEVAAMMSQLGCVTLPPEIVEAVFAGNKLSVDQQARFDAHPLIAQRLLSNIPRMESIAWMIAHQNDATLESLAEGSSTTDVDTSMGAQILRAVLAFDRLLIQGKSKQQAVHELLSSACKFKVSIIDSLSEVELEREHMDAQRCPVASLVPGMILDEDVRARNGVLLVAKGQEITFSLAARLENFRQTRSISNDVIVLVPSSSISAKC